VSRKSVSIQSASLRYWFHIAIGFHPFNIHTVCSPLYPQVMLQSNVALFESKAQQNPVHLNREREQRENKERTRERENDCSCMVQWAFILQAIRERVWVMRERKASIQRTIQLGVLLKEKMKTLRGQLNHSIECCFTH